MVFIFFNVFSDITKSVIYALLLGDDIIGINNLPRKNFDIKAFISTVLIFLNFCFIKIDIILHMHLIEWGIKKVLEDKSSINWLIKEIISVICSLYIAKISVGEFESNKFFIRQEFENKSGFWNILISWINLL